MPSRSDINSGILFFNVAIPTAKVQFLIPCCWVSGVDMGGGPLTCFDEETKTVAGLEVAEEARGSQDCEPE
jgi:hypothetical protein